MLKLRYILTAIGCAMAMMTGCNSSSSDYYEDSTSLSSSVEVTSFALEKNAKVLTNLDSIFFSIDLNEGRIFNADSLPMGTRTNRLVVTITTPGVSAAELRFKYSEDKDSVVDYLKNATDSINFELGPVILHLVALDKTTTMDYEIKVNVHKMDPDSLSWARVARRPLPSSFNVPNGQKTVRMANKICCVTMSGSRYCIATTDDITTDSWSYAEANVPTGADLSTLAATDDALYLLADGTKLMKSTDMASTWSDTGARWTSIIGGYGTTLLGVRQSASEFVHTTWPADGANETAVESNFPVTGGSQLIDASTSWAFSSQALTIGGRSLSGKRLSTVWSYDGSQWLCVSEKLPVKAEGAVVVPYTVSSTDTLTWRPKIQKALLFIGGMTSADTLNRQVFISRDMGFNWRKGDALVQLPSYIPSMKNAQGFVCNGVNTVSRSTSGVWEEMGSTPLPSWWVVAGPTSRATAPITEWETPYIYMFGGESAQGLLYNNVWRGVLNRLEFKPIQ